MKKNTQNKINSKFYAIKLFSLLALTLAIFTNSPFIKVAEAQGSRVKATYGAWQLKCGRAPGSKLEKCAIVQSVTAEDRPNVGLTVIYLKSIDGKRQLLRVIAPLGVLLPTGLGLKIDGADVGNVPFLKCGKIGCIAEVAADKNLVTKLSSGKQAVFIIFPTPEEGLGIPIQLRGFNSGLSGLR